MIKIIKRKKTEQMKMCKMMKRLPVLIIFGLFTLTVSSLLAQNTTGYMGSMNYFTGGTDFQLTQDYPIFRLNNRPDSLLTDVIIEEDGTLDRAHEDLFNNIRFTVSPWIEYNRIINRNMTLGLKYKYSGAGIRVRHDSIPKALLKYKTNHIAVPMKFNIWYRRNLVHAPLGLYMLFEPTFMISSIEEDPDTDLLPVADAVSQVAFIVGVGENLVLNDRLVLSFSAKSRLPLLDDLLRPDNLTERVVYNAINDSHWLTAQLGIGFIF